MSLKGWDYQSKTSRHSRPSTATFSQAKVIWADRWPKTKTGIQVVWRKLAWLTWPLEGNRLPLKPCTLLRLISIFLSKILVLPFGKLHFKERGLAAQLLPLLDKACMEETSEEESEEQARLVTCLREAVTMEAARLNSKMEIEFGTHWFLQVVGGDWSAWGGVGMLWIFGREGEGVEDGAVRWSGLKSCWRR